LYFSENDTFSQINDKFITSMRMIAMEDIAVRNKSLCKKRKLLREYITLNMLRFDCNTLQDIITKAALELGNNDYYYYFIIVIIFYYIVIIIIISQLL
jgi:hypothetical protein